MRSHSQILKALGPTAVAAAFGLKQPSTVHSWVQRNSIPPKYWPGIVEFARNTRVAGVTHAALAEAAAAAAGLAPRGKSRAA